MSLERLLLTGKLVEKSDNHWMLDLVLANRLQLENAGIDKSNISICEFCTSCRNDLFFSPIELMTKDRKLGCIYPIDLNIY